LLAEVENRRGQLAVLLAGYRGKMEKLFEHNEGLPSRFPVSLDFEDYSDDELLFLMQSYLKTKLGEKFRIEGGPDGKSMRILIKRLGRGRGNDGFGNARAVANLLERVRERQAERLVREGNEGKLCDDFLITKCDLLGPEPSDDILGNCAAWKELQDMIGLSSVKKSVKELVEMVKTNVELEKHEKPPLEVSLNRLFLGNPGTGKTTVAKLYGLILKELGLLSKGEIIVKKPNDFIGSALGQSEERTSAILNASKGCVLVIDEAYGLFSSKSSTSSSGFDPYKTAVIETIVGEVHNVPGDDRIVLMLGYKKQMQEMMDGSNPGLARRFSVDNAFHFEDFSNAELVRILNSKLSKLELRADFKAQLAAGEVLKKQQCRPNFGNGGAVESLLSSAIGSMTQRLCALPPSERVAKQGLVSEDFDPSLADGSASKDSVESFFGDLIGCNAVIRQMQEYRATISMAKKRGNDPLKNLKLNFRFVGSPGTGKTTVARRMGKMFCHLGLLAREDVVECSASDLVGEYVGQTGPKTQRKIEEALGGVLFIDEAYRLNPSTSGSFAKEALDELVDILTKPAVANKLVVILAGYAKDMDDLMSSNSGLASRFTERILFEDFSPEDCIQLLEMKLREDDWILSPDFGARMVPIFSNLIHTSGWGNGRDVDTLCKAINRAAAFETDECEEEEKDYLSNSLILREADKMLNSKRKLGASVCENAPVHPVKRVQPPLNNRKVTVTTTTVSNEQRSSVQNDMPNAESAGVMRDDGVSDDIWFRIQDALKLEQEEIDGARRAQEEADDAERKLREAEELARLEKEETCRLELERLRIEAEERARNSREEAERRQRERERKQAIQKKLERIGNCCMGYQWLKVGSGYRCAGGGHFVPEAQLNM